MSRSSSKHPAAPHPRSNSNTRTGSGRPAPSTGEATRRATSNDGSPNNSNNRKFPDGSTAGNFLTRAYVHTPPGAWGTPPNCKRFINLPKNPLYKKRMLLISLQYSFLLYIILIYLIKNNISSPLHSPVIAGPLKWYPQLAAHPAYRLNPKFEFSQ